MKRISSETCLWLSQQHFHIAVLMHSLAYSTLCHQTHRLGAQTSTPACQNQTTISTILIPVEIGKVTSEATSLHTEA